jgi:hypothetical protein
MRRERRRSGGQALAGALLLTLGALLFVQNLGLFEVRQYWRYWSVLPLGLGLLKLFRGQGRGDQAFGIFLTCLGAGQLAKTLGYWSPGPADIVAVTLIIVGTVFIGRGLFGRPEPDVSKDSSDWISAFAVLAGFERSNNSQDFRGGDLTALMGGCEIDLRQASLRAPASIDVFVMWGGVEIRVPADWTVDMQGVPLLAGFVDKTRPPALATEKRLIIRGMALMGGVEIKN